MTIQQQALRYGQRRLLRRLGRSIPFLGAAVALLTIGSAIRRKGVLGGTVDSALNAIPFLGGAKTAAELVRGRDFIRDRRLPR
jgi:hypothetical protein